MSSIANTAEFTRGQKVLYATTSDPNTREWTSAQILSVHFDDSPPYYTISYHKLETVASSTPVAARSSLSGSGASVREDKPKQRLVKHEKQTTATRLKVRPSKVRRSEERSDELAASMLVSKATSAGTSVRDAHPH